MDELDNELVEEFDTLLEESDSDDTELSQYELSDIELELSTRYHFVSATRILVTNRLYPS